MVCLAIVIMFILIALFAPLLTKLFGVEVRAGDPSSDTDMFNFPVIGPPDHPFTWEAPLGLAPDTGDDNLAEWFYGARTSLMIASVSTIVATMIGITIGLIAGFSRGFLDRFISFIIDVFLSLPFLVMALAVAPIIVLRFNDQPQVLKYAQVIALILILIFFGWMRLARLIRGEVLSLREREFVQAARVMGVPTRQILFKELLPNMVAPIVVSFSLTLPGHRGRGGGPVLPRHRRHRRPVVGADGPQGGALLRHLPALPLRARDRDLRPGRGAQPARRRHS